MNATKIGRYVSNIVYADTYEGLRTNEQALIIRRLYEEYDCDYIVLDTNGKNPMPLYIVIYKVQCEIKRES